MAAETGFGERGAFLLTSDFRVLVSKNVRGYILLLSANPFVTYSFYGSHGEVGQQGRKGTEVSCEEQKRLFRAREMVEGCSAGSGGGPRFESWHPLIPLRQSGMSPLPSKIIHFLPRIRSGIRYNNTENSNCCLVG